MNKVDFNIMDSCIVDHTVDHDIFNVRPRREVKEVIKEELKERDIPETQIQIVEI